MSQTLPLSAERLRELYEAFCTTDVPEWYQRHRTPYLELIERAQRWGDEELRDPAAQKQLWESDDVGGVGQGKVKTEAVHTDKQVLDALVVLRRRDWPAQPELRFQVIRGAYEELMDLVHPRLTDSRPWAKLLRVFATLVPAHFHRCFDSPSSKQVAQLVLGRSYRRVQAAVRVRERLRQVLGVEDDLSRHVERSLFCWWRQRERPDLRERAGAPSYQRR